MTIKPFCYIVAILRGMDDMDQPDNLDFNNFVPSLIKMIENIVDNSDKQVRMYF